MARLTKFSFGATSAVVTSLALIIGLSGTTKVTVILSLAVFAIADNISDSLGIHIFQESDLKKPKVVRTSTFSNFFTRLLITAVFILLVAVFPAAYSVMFSIAWGFLLLSILSYHIAKRQKADPYSAILQHLAVAIAVIAVTLLLRGWIMNGFPV